MVINELDNVEINLKNGHKYARRDIAEGENVIKYGSPIGHATCHIAAGEHVHTHNLKTNLGDVIEYKYEPSFSPIAKERCERTFMGYERENGDVGIRNDIWIIPTVGCVNEIAKRIAAVSGALAFTHPFGCSQMGEDQRITQRVLSGLVNSPNAGGVLVLGLGCENNNIKVFKSFLGEINGERVKFLNCQDSEDEISDGVKAVTELKKYAAKFIRKPISISKLRLGLKCGGSDGYSGISANPLVGKVSDMLIASGGSTVLTEVPEMFGAEHLLMQRCINEEIFKKTVDLVNGFKDYYKAHGQVIYENPSPGNKEGGITTLEEKSLGCVTKGGTSPVVDVLSLGERVKNNGLSLLWGPGNDIVAITALAASGVHMVLFTTGRGTPLGGAVPTVKIATNNELAKKKPSWIDFSAGGVLDGEDPSNELLDLIIRIASGEETKNEQNGYREISIFKDGVTL